MPRVISSHTLDALSTMAFEAATPPHTHAGYTPRHTRQHPYMVGRTHTADLPCTRVISSHTLDALSAVASEVAANARSRPEIR